MWIHKDVNLPEALIRAQRQRTLVVFAGAGVSMGPPSNLPSFDDLTERVAAGVEPRLPDEPLDRFLGRLASRDIDVQARTRLIIDDPASQPSPLHRDLARLFSSPETVRLITTNFDRHFTTALAERFPSGVDSYVAPALPLGRDFRGLVYLHGAVEKSSHRLVLTDAEFGRAYLSEAWATRFLLEAFAHYTVLFVGYSHDDVVVRYLARSLVPGTVRFALTAPGEHEKWLFLGVTPVEFPLRAGAVPFAALEEAVAAWANHAAMGSLDHERRIREIVESPPPLDLETIDYLRVALRDEVSLAYFTRHARSAEWLAWLHEEGALAPLFQRDVPLDPPAKRLAFWFAEVIALSQVSAALALVKRHHGLISGHLWHEVARALSVREDLPPAVVNAWTVVLLQSRAPEWSTRPLDRLLSRCAADGDAARAMLFLRALTRPRLALDHTSLRTAGTDESPHLGGTIRLTGDARQIGTAWRQFFVPRLEQLRDRVRHLLSANLDEANELLHAAGIATGRFDPVSYRRSAIEPHEQDRYRGSVDPLIDCARELLEWLLVHHTGEADLLIADWARSDAPVLVRLAVHGLAEHPSRTPDDLIAEVVRRSWLYRSGAKHEVFRLLKGTAGRAQESTLETLVAAAAVQPVLSESPDEAETEPGDGDQHGEPGTRSERQEISDYERFNLAVWLSEAAPDSPSVREFLARTRRDHPEYERREHPDLGSGSGGVRVVVPQSPLGPERLLERAPASLIDMLSTYAGEPASRGSWGGPDRPGLLAAVGEAARQQFHWGWALALELTTQEVWHGDVWNAVLTAWRTAAVTPDEWAQVIGLLEQTPQLDALNPREAADLLQRTAEDASESVADAQLDAAERVSDRIFGSCPEGDTVFSFSGFDWLGRAINQVGGRLATFWLRSLSVRRRRAGDAWSGLPPESRERFEQVIAGVGLCAERARTVIASQAHFLVALDPDWAIEHCVPLFDWDIDALRAQQAWHGYLGWERLSEPLFAGMLPHYLESFSRLGGDLADVRHEFCQQLAASAVFLSTDPWTSGWLPAFVRDADEESRSAWARDVAHLLADLSGGAQQDLWSRWIRRYWEERLTGLPRPFTAEEGAHMLTWALALPACFEDAVSALERTPVRINEHDSFFHDLRGRTALLAEQPTPVARLVLRALSGTAAFQWECMEADSTVRALLSGGADRAVLLAIVEELSRLGCSTAQELHSLLNGH